MDKIRLGELVVDRKTWVRDNFSLDHARCLTNDLVNGAKFPPLKIDKKTKIVVGGNHRYYAYKTYFGEGWEEREIDVEFLDLPPFDEDPIAWFAVALEDNHHLAERLRYNDRNRTARNLLTALGDPDSPQAKEFAGKLHFTPQGWKEFAGLILDSFQQPKVETVEERPEQSRDDKKTVAAQNKPVSRKQRPAKNTTNDIYPSDVKSCGVNAQIMSKASGLIAILKDLDPDYLSDRSRELLEELVELVGDILKFKVS